MSELDDFLRWVSRSRRPYGKISVGYSSLAAAIDLYRAEQAAGRPMKSWVEASEYLQRRSKGLTE